MQQTYDMWLKKHNPGKPGEGTPLGAREGEKQIQMPTDYADIMVTPARAAGRGRPPRGVQSGHPRWLCPQMGYHCWLCGKNSNSKKQWQQHIQSEKHKEKVFTSDSDASGWAYRFPMGEFRLCDRCAGRAAPGDGRAQLRPSGSGDGTQGWCVLDMRSLAPGGAGQGQRGGGVRWVGLARPHFAPLGPWQRLGRGGACLG